MSIISQISQWLSSDKTAREQAQAQLEARLSQLETTLVAEREKQQAQTEELERLRKEEQLRADRQQSVEPWVEITGETIDPVRGVQIALDWNPAFIQYLKENGITGRDEDEAVQKWLALLYKDMTDRLETKVISNSDTPRVPDYV